MPRKTPFRPGNEISQAYNDGIVKICVSADAAKPGYHPTVQACPKFTLPFAERVLGINRVFLGRQNRVEISRVLRVPRVNISTQDLAQTHDGNWYSIKLVQSVEGVKPPSLDISLEAVSHQVEVIP